MTRVGRWQVSHADRLSPRCSLSRCGCVSLAGCARRDGDGAPSPRPWPPSGAPDSKNASHRLRGSPAQAPGRPPLFCPALAKARYPSPRHRSRAAPPERRSPQTLAAALARRDLARRSLQVTARCLGRSRLMTAVGRVSGAAPPGSSGRPVAKNPMCRCCRPRDAAKEQLGRGAVPQRRQCAVREVHAAGQGVGVGRRCRVVSRRAGPGKWSASPRRSQRPSTSRQR